jgi:hypothetical protein
LWIIQGNNGGYSHDSAGDAWVDYAWDFCQECGMPVLASHCGTVLTLDLDLSGHCSGNNYILIDHGDDTHRMYLHMIQQDMCELAMLYNAGPRLQRLAILAKAWLVIFTLKWQGTGVPLSP